MQSRRQAIVALVMAAAALAGCGAEPAKPETDPAVLAMRAVVECRFDGLRVVSAVTGAGSSCTEKVVVAGDTAQITSDANGRLTLQVGAMSLPELSIAGCTMVFEGCTVGPGRWSRYRATLAHSATGLAIDWLPTVVQAHKQPTCPGAMTIALDESAQAAAATSSLAALAEALTDTCVSKPYTCGDGQCEVSRGEGCLTCTEDCACTDGATCVGSGGAGVCAGTCSPDKPSCPTGQRCDPVEPALDATEKVWSCHAAGKVPIGKRCLSSEECVAGAWCLRAALDPTWKGAWPGVCASKCDGTCKSGCAQADQSPFASLCVTPCDHAVAGQCGAGLYCESSGEISHLGGGPYYFAFGTSRCIAVPPTGLLGLGEPCVVDDGEYIACGDGLICYNGGTSGSYCTAACKTSSDCGPSGWTCDLKAEKLDGVTLCRR